MVPRGKTVAGTTLPESVVPPELPPIASVEEEESSELDYADDPPVPHVKGTTQGKQECLTLAIKPRLTLLFYRLGWVIEQVPNSASVAKLVGESFDSATR